MSLGAQGVNSLLAVNSWIGVINSNLQGASRNAYKTVRPHLVDAPSNNYLGERIQIPPATLNIQATSIEWAQGSVVNSNYSSHFAIQGQGFFVVADPLGKYFLSRDGEFHWDGNGYLVNSSGLRVLSSGQDFIRRSFQYDRSDAFSPAGESQELFYYGDKSFLIVDVANRDGLVMSRYGSTILEFDGDIPLRVENAFESSSDGLTFLYRDPKQLTFVDQLSYMPKFTPFAVGTNSDFSIDFGGNGLFNFRNFNAGVDFDPAVNTIRDVENAINAYGIANNTNITASYDPTDDRLKIINITAPKIPDPGFIGGNFGIDFGDNGFFTFYAFDPNKTRIQDIITQINNYGISKGVNISASFNPVTDTFTLINDTGAGVNNEIIFDGTNGKAIADMFRMNEFNATTGGGLRTINSAGDIDFNPPSVNTFSDITAQDIGSLSLNELINPPSNIVFTGANGHALSEFFKFWGHKAIVAVDPITGFSGSELKSYSDIDNSSVLNNPAGHSLDITAADVAARPFDYYVNTSDITYPVQDFGGPPAIYTHDKRNALIISDGRSNNGHGLIAIGQAQSTDEFEITLDFEVARAAASSVLEYHFGNDRPESIDTGGFSLYYDTATGSVALYQRGLDPNDPPILLQSLPANTLPITNNLGNPSRMALSLDRDGQFAISVQASGVGAGMASFDLSSSKSLLGGYLVIGNQANELTIHNIYADFKAFQNTSNTGQMVSLGNRPYSMVERSPASRTDKEGPRIIQSALESSTASLTEYLPLLSLAQKMFSSISKIIQTESRLLDEMNSLIR